MHDYHPVVTVNDHHNLLYIVSDAYRHSTVSTAARHRLARWALYMTEGNVRVVVHIPGISNHLADLLSRNGNPAYMDTRRGQRSEHVQQTEHEAADIAMASGYVPVPRHTRESRRHG